MNKILLLLSLVILFKLNGLSAYFEYFKPALLSHSFGINEDVFVRIPPPNNVLDKSASDHPTQFRIVYSNFPEEAKTAFDFAVKIWQGLLHSEMTINIYANWSNLNPTGNTNTLGSAGATSYYKDLVGLPQSGVFYNVVLAEKYLRSDLNARNSPDIYAEFDSGTKWYFGTDGQTPAGHYDFVTVALHELCHGLGFYGSLTINKRGLGTWGFGANYPFTYDQHIYNGKGNRLIDLNLFPNPSSQLAAELTSNDIYFSGPVVNAKFGSKVALYAPNPFRKGSSIDHLGDNYIETADRLLTAGIPTGLSIHNPGIITMSLMEDIGWSSISIIHEPFESREEIEDISISALFKHDPSLQLVNPQIKYSINNSAYKTSPLTINTESNNYLYDIPISEATELSYYISVTDQYGRVYDYPNTAPNKVFKVLIGPDNVKPNIHHIRNNTIFLGEDKLLLLANATDMYGIDSVWVEYYHNGARKNDTGLRATTNNRYNVLLDLEILNLQPGDIIEYRIVAMDGSSSSNTSYHPEEGFHSLEVIEIPEYLETYETDFISGINEFYLNDFEINIARSFSEPALQSRHPYRAAGEGKTADYIAELVYPIKIQDAFHYISFDQIALIEPGEPGSRFGDQNFHDYVIVEGSKDGGLTWLPFSDGWDCRLHPIWEETYEQSLYFNNFDILGDLDLFRNHQVNLLGSGDFKVGDIVNIRFRLHSDPFEAAWGWAIKNLKIQTVGLSAPMLSKSGFNVYPNPVTDHAFTIKGIKERILNIKVYDSNGKLITVPSYNQHDERVMLPAYMQGLYILRIETEKNVYTSKIQVR